MVTLDHQLLIAARGCMTSDNRNVITKLIAAYKQAVALHNTHSPGHEFYHDESERNLRRSVFDERMMQIKARSAEAQEQAALLMHRSEKLHQKSDSLNARINEVLKRFSR